MTSHEVCAKKGKYAEARSENRKKEEEKRKRGTGLTGADSYAWLATEMTAVNSLTQTDKDGPPT